MSKRATGAVMFAGSATAFRIIVRRYVRRIFAGLSRGDYSLAVDGLADHVHHVFAGEHPLGGERHSRDAVELWFERLYRLYDMRFEVNSVNVTGPPWDVSVSVEWIGHATPRAGTPYINQGAHVIRIRRGKVVYLHAYEDSQKVAEACRQMAAAGIDEAAAPPILR